MAALQDKIANIGGDNPNKLDEMVALPPAGGQEVIPHVSQFISLINSVSKVYKHPDQAIRHSRTNARAMLHDLSILEPLQARQLAVAELRHEIQPENPEDPFQVDTAKRLNDIVEGIPRFLRWKLSLAEAIWYGRCANQNLYEWRFNKSKTLEIADWIPINGDTLVFKWDTRQLGILIGPSFGIGTAAPNIPWIPTDQGRAHILSDWERSSFVLHQHFITSADYFEPEAAGAITGYGIRNYLYWTWYLKNELLSWLVEYAERTALGIWVYFYESGNPNSFNQAKEAAEKQAFSTRLLYPYKTGADSKNIKPFEYLEPNNSGMKTFVEIIDNYFGRMIKQYILGQTLTSEAHATGLGSSVADAHERSLHRIIAFDAANLEDTINLDLMPVLMKWNFPTANFKCKFKFVVDRPDTESFLSGAREFFNLGGSLKESQVREVLGLTEPEEGDKVLQKQPGEGDAKDAFNGATDATNKMGGEEES